MNIIVTGAGRGIGYETAKWLSENHKVICISRSAEKNKIKGTIAISFDFENGNIQNELLPKLIKVLSKEKKAAIIDVLINNAAAFIKKPFQKITPEDWEKLFKVNVFSVAELTRSILESPLSPIHKNNGPRAHVLNIASMGGIQGSVKFPELSAYSTSKGAVITLTECLAEEFKEKNISFNAIAFGAVQTEMLSKAFPGFKAPFTAKDAAMFTADFALTGQKYFNGKVLQMALSTP
ncbi:MAG TPA: SDR family oxidoreductase [Bacteroidia bacterium]|nr:SDR family oxidoreductase [Bacteroidia bacterium]